MLKNLLHRLLGRPQDNPAPSSLEASPLTVLAMAPPPQAADAIDIDTMFFPWLLGMGDASVHDLNEPESRILRALKRVADSNDPTTADLVPRMPSVIPLLLRSLRERNVSNSQLAEQISQDAVLVAAVLKQVNSSYFRRSSPVTGIEGALAIIGQNGLRMLVASVAFKPLFNVALGYSTSRAAPLIWQLSAPYGVACRFFAKRGRIDGFEAFLAGLLQNVGVIVALRVMDQAPPVQPGDLRSLAFYTSFAHYTRRLARIVGTQWEFPEQVIAAIDRAAAPAHSAGAALSEVLRLADKVAKLRMLVKHGRLKEEYVEACVDGEDVAACLACYREIAAAEADEG